ncbi:MAG: hypothetical protein ACFB15_24115 [Cyclobacteriaceae bacterium]
MSKLEKWLYRRMQRKTYPDTDTLAQTIRHTIQQLTTTSMIKQPPMLMYKTKNGQ